MAAIVMILNVLTDHSFIASLLSAIFRICGVLHGPSVSTEQFLFMLYFASVQSCAKCTLSWQISQRLHRSRT